MATRSASLTVLLAALALVAGVVWLAFAAGRSPARGDAAAPIAVAAAPGPSSERRAGAELLEPPRPAPAPAALAPRPAAEAAVAAADAVESARVSVPVAPPTFRLRGVVRLAGGSRLERGRGLVTLQRAGEPDVTTTTGRNGAWSFDGVPPGACQLSFEADGYEAAQLDVEVRGDAAPREVQVELVPMARLRVHLQAADLDRIRAWLDGDEAFAGNRKLSVLGTYSRPGAVLSADVVRAGGDRGISPFLHRSGSSLVVPELVDSRFGSVGLGVVPADVVGVFAGPRRATICVNLCVGTAVLQTVEVPPTVDDVTFTLSSWDLERLLTQASLGVVDRDSQRPLPGVDARLRGLEGRSIAARTDDRGVARFERVLPGTYALAVEAQDRVVREERVLVGAGQTDLGTWELDLRATIRGRVVDARGQPVAASLVARPIEAVDQQRFVRPVRGGSSDLDGTFALAEAGRGPHLLLLESEAYAARPLRVDTTGGDVFDVLVEVVPAAALAIELADSLPEGALVRLETPEGLPVFAALPRTVRHYDLALAPGDYRLRVLLQGRQASARDVTVGGGSQTLRVE